MWVLRREMPHGWPWPRAQEQMKSHNLGQAPPRGGVLHRVPLVVGKRRLMVPEGLTDAVLQGRIDEQTDRHDHQPRHDPLGRFASEGRGQTLRVCEEPTAPCRRLLACIACQQGLRCQRSVVKCMRGHATPLLRHQRLTSSDRSGQGAGHRGQHLVGLGAMARPTPRPRARRETPGPRVPRRALSAWRKRRARLLGRWVTGLSVDPQPAWCPLAVGRRSPVIALARLQGPMVCGSACAARAAGAALQVAGTRVIPCIRVPERG